MTKISSRLLSHSKQCKRSVLFVAKRHFRNRNVTDNSKSLAQLDMENRYDKFDQCGFLVISYIFLMAYCFYSRLWLPYTMPSDNLPPNILKEINERTYVERCSPYSSAHAFHSFLTTQCCNGFFLAFITYPILLIVTLHVNGLVQLVYELEVFLTLLFCLIGSCSCMQLISALTCRPIEILYDVRFISTLTAQLFGFMGCLLFAYGLGSISSTKIPKGISRDKVSLIPFSQSFTDKDGKDGLACN